VPAFVVFSGLPASGKTTLAASVASELRLAHLDKDALLEDIFSTTSVRNSDDRRALSRRADAEFERLALQLPIAALSSWWRHPASTRASGTPTAWLQQPGFVLVELHCKCSPALAAQRFLARQRHASHLDHLRNSEDLLVQFSEADALGPLFPESAIEVNTSRALDAVSMQELLRQVQAQLKIASEA